MPEEGRERPEGSPGTMGNESLALCEVKAQLGAKYLLDVAFVDRQIAGGGIVHRSRRVQEVEAGPGGAADDVRDPAPLDTLAGGLRGGVDQVAAADGGLPVFSSPVSLKTWPRVKPRPATPV